MRLPQAYYQMTRTIAAHLPHVRRAHCSGLALGVYGTLLAQSACHNAVITALLTRGTWHTVWHRVGLSRAQRARLAVVAPALRRAPSRGCRRWGSVFRRGLQALRQTLGRGYLWRRCWLVPAPWPEPPPDLMIPYHIGP